MIPTLRDYQQGLIDRTRVALRTNRNVLVQAPTGAGKTLLSAFMTGSAVRKGWRVGFIVHRRELIKQTSATFTNVGIPHGLVAAGITGDRRQPVQICGVQTLANRLDWFDFGLLIIDEAHHATAKQWADVIAHYSKARVIGLSATPERMDGAGLDKHFDALVPGPRVAWLIENGYLSPYRLYAPSVPDLAGVHTTAGDYNRGELGEAMSKPQIIGDLVEHYRRLAPGRRNMVFCASIKHSLAVVDKFQSAGFRAAHIDGATDNDERDRMIAKFTAGEIQVLSSVDLVSEGFDLPAIEVATLARPTKSLSLYIQQVGRCLRTAPGKAEAIILDHAGNALRHGLPDDEREWTLAGRAKKRRSTSSDEPDVQVRQCPACYSVHKSAPVCPRCGHEYQTMGRTIKEIEGELQEMQRAAEQKEKKTEVARAKSKDELIAIGRMRGYKNPGFWAQKIIEARSVRAYR